MEIGADIVMKATNVDGVYDKDPKKFKDARMFRRLSYLDVLNRHLAVMDSTAISLCQRQQAAHSGLQHDQAGQHPARRAGRAARAPWCSTSGATPRTANGAATPAEETSHGE